MAKLKSAQKNNFHIKIFFARFNRLITGLAVVLILLSGYHFILSPKFQQAGQSSLENLNLAKNELAKRQAYFDQLNALVENYNKISPQDIQKMKLILPRDKDIAGLLVQFQQLAGKNNLLLASINFNDVPETKDTVKKISINVSLLGGGKSSYGEIRDFIASVETNVRLFDIQSVFFKPDSSAYSMTIFAYYY